MHLYVYTWCTGPGAVNYIHSSVFHSYSQALERMISFPELSEYNDQATSFVWTLPFHSGIDDILN